MSADTGHPDPVGGDDGKSPVGEGVSASGRGAGGGSEAGTQNGNPGASNAVVRLRPKPDSEIDRAAARFPLTDLGNAERFVLRFGADFRFVAEWGWLWYDGARWMLLSEEKDRVPAAVMQAVFATVRAIKNEAVLVRRSGVKTEPPPHFDAAQVAAHDAQMADCLDYLIDAKKGVYFSDKVAEWARSSESAARLSCIATLAKAFDGISAKVDDFDADRMAINCQNGTLRIERRKVKRSAEEVAAGKSVWKVDGWQIRCDKHNRDDLITKITNVAYKPNASAPVYDAFINTVQPDATMRRFIMQWGGLSLTGDIGEQKLAFFYGQGRNGKGTWVEAVAYLAGDYAGSLPIESLLDNGKRRGDQATPDIARLPGVRFLRVSEPSKGAVLNEGLVKMVTGGDPVDARHLNKGLFTFLPEFKMTISGNQKPAIRDESDGIWRRMQLVPWNVQIAREDIDKDLPTKLRQEAEGIFARLIAGLLDWKANGLIEPDEVRMATSKYRDDSDAIGKFLRQCCLLGEDTRARPMRTRKKELFELYTAWAQSGGHFEFKNRQFSKAMEAKGFVDMHSNGEWWVGVSAQVTRHDIEQGVWSAVDNAENVGEYGDGDSSAPFGPDDDLPDWYGAE